MRDVDYVKAALAENYSTEHAHEIPYPDLDSVILTTTFDYLSGVVEGEIPNGSKSREGQDYLWFKHVDKSILSHRFIVAVSLGKWPPRDFDVDHVNHDPSDNRPSNLRVVTRRDNAGNRRSALLSELVDLNDVATSILIQKQPKEPEPKEVNRPQAVLGYGVEDRLASLRPSGAIPTVTYTGETKAAEHSNGIWRKTNLGSWHLHFDEAPRIKRS